jgi:hypothetical protein
VVEEGGWGLGKGAGVRWLSVETDADGFQLGLEEGSLLCLFGRIEHHEDEVARLRRRDDLPTAPLAFRGTFDDTGQIEQLDFGAAIFEDAGDGCEGGEGI